VHLLREGYLEIAAPKNSKEQHCISMSGRVECKAPVVQRLDNAIHRINHYPVDTIRWIAIHSADSGNHLSNNPHQNC